MWIGRPKQRDCWDMEASGEMGQSGIMSDETMGMGNDSSHREKIEILEHPKWLRISTLEVCQLIHVRWSTDH